MQKFALYFSYIPDGAATKMTFALRSNFLNLYGNSCSLFSPNETSEGYGQIN